MVHMPVKTKQFCSERSQSISLGDKKSVRPRGGSAGLFCSTLRSEIIYLCCMGTSPLLCGFLFALWMRGVPSRNAGGVPNRVILPPLYNTSDYLCSMFRIGPLSNGRSFLGAAFLPCDR